MSSIINRTFLKEYPQWLKSADEGDWCLSGCYATAVFCHACAQCIVGVSERCWISARAEEQRRLEMVQHQQGEKAQRSRQRNYAALLKLSVWDFTPSTEEQVSKLFFVGQVVVFFKQNAAVAIRLSLVCWHLVNSDAALARAAGFHRRCACRRKQNPSRSWQTIKALGPESKIETRPFLYVLFMLKVNE